MRGTGDVGLALDGAETGMQSRPQAGGITGAGAGIIILDEGDLLSMREP
jgi:hypothetical protein